MRGRAEIGFVLATLFVAGCTEIYNTLPTGPGGGTTVVITQNQDSQNVGTPAAGGATASGPIARVKVGFYGGTCPSGPMQAGQVELQQGCNGDMTATPKVKLPDGGERDATELEHGTADEVKWVAEIGADVLVCVTSPANGFNRICSAKKAGPWRQCAYVKGVEGCAAGNVT